MRFFGASWPTAILHTEETEKALEFFHKAERVFLESGPVPNYQVCLANTGNVYHYRREFLKAISYYQRAFELARQLSDDLSIGKWLHNLAQAYTSLGNPALAQEFENEVKRVKESPSLRNANPPQHGRIFRVTTRQWSCSGGKRPSARTNGEGTDLDRPD